MVPPVPAPLRIPKLTSALLFKLPGGVSGEVGTALIRAKEIERRLGLARIEANKTVREEKRAVQDTDAWGSAATALEILEANSFDLSKLKKDQLAALVRALQIGKSTGLNKPALQALLVERFGNLTAEQFADIKTAVQRGVALTLLPPPPKPTVASTSNEPAEALLDSGLLLSALADTPAPPVEAPMPLALTRPRRHPHKGL